MATLTLNKEEDVFVTFQSLVLEETHLNEQKESFTNLLCELETKARAELEKMKQRVDSLNLEVFELKEKCNKLRLWIKESITIERSQVTRPEEKCNDDKVIAAIPEGVPATPTENQSRPRF